MSASTGTRTATPIPARLHLTLLYEARHDGTQPQQGGQGLPGGAAPRGPWGAASEEGSAEGGGGSGRGPRWGRRVRAAATSRGRAGGSRLTVIQQRWGGGGGGREPLTPSVPLDRHFSSFLGQRLRAGEADVFSPPPLREEGPAPEAAPTPDHPPPPSLPPPRPKYRWGRSTGGAELMQSGPGVRRDPRAPTARPTPEAADPPVRPRRTLTGGRAVSRRRAALRGRGAARREGSPRSEPISARLLTRGFLSFIKTQSCGDVTFLSPRPRGGLAPPRPPSALFKDGGARLLPSTLHRPSLEWRSTGPSPLAPPRWPLPTGPSPLATPRERRSAADWFALGH